MTQDSSNNIGKTHQNKKMRYFRLKRYELNVLKHFVAAAEH